MGKQGYRLRKVPSKHLKKDKRVNEGRVDKDKSANGISATGLKIATKKVSAPLHKSEKKEPIYENPSPKLPSSVGNVLVFGNGDCGQLGMGEDVTEKKKPSLVPALKNIPIVDVAVGGMHNIAITADGKLYSWGCNDQKALGRSGPEDVPAQVEGLDDVKVIKVACGDSISVALSSAGEVYTWGTYRSAEGILGYSVEQDMQELPTKLGRIADEFIVDIVAGVDHVLALTREGRVYGWGNGQQNQIGRRIIERRKRNGLTPERLILKHVKLVGAGSYHSFAVTANNEVYSWGLNNYYQCGRITNEAGRRADIIPTPTIVGELPQEEIVKQVTGGEHHSLILMESGRVYTFGRGDSSQLGLPKKEMDARMQMKSSEFKKAIPTPTLVPGLSKIEEVACGSNHNLAYDSDGRVYSWGYGEMLACGNGTEVDVPEPFPLESKALAGKNIYRLGAGGQHSVLLVGPP